VNRNISFNSINQESTCIFQTYLSKISAQALKIFSIPPCYAIYECHENSYTHINKIKCDIDGKFNSQAICLKNS
jgi:uncharacterized CHY-type Zn-finger protein